MGSRYRTVHSAYLAVQGSKGKSKARKTVHASLRLAELCAGMDASSFPLGAMVPAVIRTVEDTGCTCLVGVSGVSAFLPAAAFSAAYGASTRPTPGQIVQTVVAERLRDGGSLVLGCDAAAVANATTTEFHGISLGSLLPGQLVTVSARTLSALLCSWREPPCR